MSVDSFLSRLHGVRKRGADQWSACCPAHEDRSPSLSVKELADGRILIHCFAGCGIDEVLGAVGMSLADIMPERLEDHRAPRNARIPGHLLTVALDELAIIRQCAGEMVSGFPVSDADARRLEEARRRLEQIARQL